MGLLCALVGCMPQCIIQARLCWFKIRNAAGLIGFIYNTILDTCNKQFVPGIYKCMHDSQTRNVQRHVVTISHTEFIANKTPLLQPTETTCRQRTHLHGVSSGPVTVENLNCHMHAMHGVRSGPWHVTIIITHFSCCKQKSSHVVQAIIGYYRHT